ncbi:hypothetical protein [Collimonas humicola]|uniref:hypothetical protein n=1 Tax=Collimonas humicola TaxID=2825886 RepID=UPI001B8C4154|nr:hypothetical protein [Collimonas humicola]
MSEKPKLPALPALPKLGGLPALPTLPKLKTIAEMERANENPLDRNNERYLNDAEHDSELDAGVIADEFATLRAARKQQADAIELANDSEFWFAMYFQTREQKEAFVAALGLKQDKYIDGQEAARILGITLPPRPAPYKVGKVDRKLAALT